jgi:fructose 1,6-bisphosphate aldolase/phosphatase
MNTPGLILSPNMSKGFRHVVMDVNHTEGDRVIELETPAEIYDLAALLRATERHVVESVWSRASGEQAAAVATSHLHNIAGKYTGKDDPVMLVRVQMNFPATGEVLAPYSIGQYVAGCMRGSHQMPLMPVPLNSGTSYFDGPPLVSCAAFAMHQGKLTERWDAFAHPFWNRVRDKVADKATDMRRQGFFGAAMLPMSELEYTGIMDKTPSAGQTLCSPLSTASHRGRDCQEPPSWPARCMAQLPLSRRVCIAFPAVRWV